MKTQFIPNKYFNNPNFDTFESINLVSGYICQTSYLKEVASTFVLMVDFSNVPMKDFCEDVFLDESW